MCVCVSKGSCYVTYQIFSLPCYILLASHAYLPCLFNLFILFMCMFNNGRNLIYSFCFHKLIILYCCFMQLYNLVDVCIIVMLGML